MKKHRTRHVGVVTLFVCLLALSLFAATLKDGVNSPFLDSFVLIVAMVGLLLGSEIGYAFTTLSLIIVVGFYLVDRSGLMAGHWSLPSAEFVTSMRLIHLLLAYVLIYLITKRNKSEVARAQSEALLQHLANHDSLTGLPNRMLFFDRLNHAVQKTSRLGGKLAVAFLDLNNFKMVNDTYGHGKGDLIIRDVAERLKTGIRASDTIARLGGDEFTFIFEAIKNPGDALNISQKIIETLKMPFCIDGGQVLITASVGVSLFPDDGDDTAALLGKADEAMYASKLLGQNKCRLYSAEYLEQSDVFQVEDFAVKK